MKLYGYYYNSCIHESADALQSLHLTKAEAYRAMRKAKYDAAMEDRENSPYKLRGWTKQKPVDWKAWSIRELEVEGTKLATSNQPLRSKDAHWNSDRKDIVHAINHRPEELDRDTLVALVRELDRRFMQLWDKVSFEKKNDLVNYEKLR